MSYEYTEEQKAILQKLEDAIKENKSQKRASMVIGMSDTVISKLRKGTYDGDVEEQMQKLADYFNVKEQHAKLSVNISTDYVETSISSEIYTVLNLCQIKGGLAVAAGDAGIGKTKAVLKYLKDHPSNTVSITMNTCFSTVKSLLKLIAKRVNAGKTRLQDEMWDAILEKLSDGMFLIVDEAQFLTYSQIEALRSFSDYFSDMGQTFGIALVGNPQILFTMESRCDEYAQIINRRKITLIYQRSDIQRADIQKLFPAVADDKQKIDFLWKMSQTVQGIRGTVELYNLACQNNNCSYEGLVAAAKRMNIK
ncbi:MAG: AAA family ATPase [Oscillospiraceae bacterium]|nr:AAA family ATPase [Oscillospiraceae bacterium]